MLKKLIPKVEFLDLSHNQLSTVENLQVCACQHCKNDIIISSRSSQKQDVRVCFVFYNQHMFLFVLFPFLNHNHDPQKNTKYYSAILY